MTYIWFYPSRKLCCLCDSQMKTWKISRDSEATAAIEAGLVLTIRSCIDFQKDKLLALQYWTQCSWKSKVCLGVAAFAYTSTTPAKQKKCMPKYDSINIYYKWMSINTQSEVVVSCCDVHLTGCHTICLLVAQFCWLRGSRFTSPELCRFSMYFLNKIKHIDLLYREKCFCNVLN